MKRLLKIVGLGLIIWSFSWVWPFVNVVLTPRVTDAIVVGLVVAVSAYLLGQHFTQPLTKHQESNKADLARASRPIRPSVPVIYPFNRTSRPTRPIPELLGPAFHSRRTHPMSVNTIRNHFSRQTSPMPVVARNSASRPTRPMPLARSS